jgi:hypothetical protein
MQNSIHHIYRQSHNSKPAYKNSVRNLQILQGAVRTGWRKLKTLLNRSYDKQGKLQKKKKEFRTGLRFRDQRREHFALCSQSYEAAQKTAYADRAEKLEEIHVSFGERTRVPPPHSVEAILKNTKKISPCPCGLLGRQERSDRLDPCRGEKDHRVFESSFQKKFELQVSVSRYQGELVWAKLSWKALTYLHYGHEALCVQVHSCFEEPQNPKPMVLNWSPKPFQLQK